MAKKSLTNSKFNKSIAAGSNEALKRRSEKVAQSTYLAAKAKLNALEMKLDQKNTEIDNHTDIGPDNSMSTRPVNENFDGTKWIEKLFELKLEAEELKIQKAIMDGIINEWFDEETE